MPKAPLIVTQPSLQNLAEALDKHTVAKFSAQREAKVAKEWGDLSENAEYKASKEKFRLAGRLQQRVGRELKGLQDQGYTIVDPLVWTKPGPALTQVEVGTVVEICGLGGSAQPEWYLLAGAKDNALPPDAPVTGIPYTSPLGQALMGQAVPGHCLAQIAGSPHQLELRKLRRPDRAEILALWPELS